LEGDWRPLSGVSAARLGVKVLLVERYGFLGGTITAGLVNPFMPFHARKQQIIGGIFQEVIDRLEGMGGYDAKTRAFDPEIMKYILDRIVLEVGVDLLLHTVFVGVSRRHVGGLRHVGVILREGKGGSWDCRGASWCYAYKDDDGTLYLYYSGFGEERDGTEWSIGLAKSKDGLSFNKFLSRSSSIHHSAPSEHGR